MKPRTDNGALTMKCSVCYMQFVCPWVRHLYWWFKLYFKPYNKSSPLFWLCRRSPSLVDRPSDWPSHCEVVGFINVELQKLTKYSPPKELADFLSAGEWCGKSVGCVEKRGKVLQGKEMGLPEGGRITGG